jgi:glycosyltransferase involved in cell wall biosynthesis
LRVTVVTAQLRGHDRIGGVGTATAFLTLGLRRSGHTVEVFYIGDAALAGDEWTRLYEEASVPVHKLAVSESVDPPAFRRIAAVEKALRDAKPDVVVAHEFGAPAYAAQRLRSLGLGHEETTFVIFCHGTRRWVKSVTRNPAVSRDVLLESCLERASVELADVVVSPSAFMLQWMRDQGWALPGTSRVIPYVTRSAALGEIPARPKAEAESLLRLTFFGRREEIKGVGPFVVALNSLDPSLLQDVELEFLGAETKQWTCERVEQLLAQRPRSLSFVTDLDQHEALERLARPGTLAVMPSLADNSPNTVYECLERGIPFLASDSGGIAELIAPEDRARVLFEPTAAGVSDALRRALSSPDALRPARPAFDGQASLDAWEHVLQVRPALRPDSVAIDEGEWALVVEDGDEADVDLFQTLMRAQLVSGADVVTCGLRMDGRVSVFAGETDGLEVLGNHYGAAALLRARQLGGDGERVWPLLARLSADGARIVSVPLPLVKRMRPRPRDPVDALAVVEGAEHWLPREARSLARLVAGLAADAERQSG